MIKDMETIKLLAYFIPMVPIAFLGYHHIQLRKAVKEGLELSLNQEGALKFLYDEIVRIRNKRCKCRPKPTKSVRAKKSN